MQLFTLGGALVGIIIGIVVAIWGTKIKQSKLAQTGLLCCVFFGSIGGLILAIPTAALFCFLIKKAANKTLNEKPSSYRSTSFQSSSKHKLPVVRDSTQPLKIVHVDDDDLVLKHVRRTFLETYRNVVIKTFQKSNDAWSELLKEEPDLLITDDKMQELSGEEIVRQLVERGVQYPIIVTSGFPPTEQWVSKYKAHKSNIIFLPVPFTRPQFLNALWRQLGKQLQFNAPNMTGLNELSGNAPACQTETEIDRCLKKAEAGDAESQYTIGIQYERGQFGFPQSYIEAAKWYRKAAAQGHSGAQLYLGVFLAQGQGVEPNFVEAYQWIELAKRGNMLDKFAADDCQKRLIVYMTPEQIVEGQRLARAFVSTGRK